MKEIYFYFPGCDATLNLKEFLSAVALGIGICAAPFIIKALLSLIY